MFTTAGKTFATASTAGSEAGSTASESPAPKATEASRRSAEEPRTARKDRDRNLFRRAGSLLQANIGARPALSTCPPGKRLQRSEAMRPSFATRGNLDLIDDNYRRWQKDPDSVDAPGARFSKASSSATRRSATAPPTAAAPRADGRSESPLQTRVDGLVYAYRTLGHTIARVNPLADKRPENPLLTLRELGFSEKDLDLQVSSKFFLDGKQMTLREMIAALEEIYADTIGARIPAHPESADPQLGARPDRGAADEASRLDRSGDRAAPAAPGIGSVRGFPAHPLRRAEALFAPGRGVAHGDSRHDSASLPGRRDRGNLHGHGASRPAQRAREFPPEIAQGDLHRVQHELHSRTWSRATAT